MFHDLAVFTTGALIVGAVMGLAWLATNERSRRIAETKARLAVEARMVILETQVSAYDRAKNPLYRESIEDQRARQLNAADSVAVGVEHMLNAIRILAPEMLKKGKR